MKLILMPGIVFFLLGGCCGSHCCAQEFIITEREESTSADSAEELAIDTPLPPSADVVPTVTFARCRGVRFADSPAIDGNGILAGIRDLVQELPGGEGTIQV